MRYAGRGGGPPGLAAPLLASDYASLSGACTVSLDKCVRVGLHKQSPSCNQDQFEPASLLKAVAMLTLFKKGWSAGSTSCSTSPTVWACIIR